MILIGTKCATRRPAGAENLMISFRKEIRQRLLAVLGNISKVARRIEGAFSQHSLGAQRAHLSEVCKNRCRRRQGSLQNEFKNRCFDNILNPTSSFA